MLCMCLEWFPNRYYTALTAEYEKLTLIIRLLTVVTDPSTQNEYHDEQVMLSTSDTDVLKIYDANILQVQ